MNLMETSKIMSPGLTETYVVYSLSTGATFLRLGGFLLTMWIWGPQDTWGKSG